MTKAFDPAVREFLDGRVWLRLHTPFSHDLIDDHIKQGYIHVHQGVMQTKKIVGVNRYNCVRCKNNNQFLFTVFHCLACNGPCAYCRNCLRMGRVSCCSDLIVWKGPKLDYPVAHNFAWSGVLTAQQRKASEELQESMKKKRPHLIHAVCGSGKTEILFEPIFKALAQGCRVCVASPRVDVILELEPRFRAAFPTTVIEALYGEAIVKRYDAQLILATTHQLHRFHEAFDVVFVDEADAFPYTADVTLRNAVQKAATPQAPIHYVTATPPDKLVSYFQKHGAVSTINRRYHGQALPEPTFTSLWKYEKILNKNKIPKALGLWVQKRIDKKEPFLIFFHTIELMMQAEKALRTVDDRIRAVYSSHPERKKYVHNLRAGEIPGLLTTTILERGITIKNLQVAVVGAEQSIFNEGAIVQIGGRVGRDMNYPTGEFVLFHNGISYAMDRAKREIQRLNRGVRK